MSRKEIKANELSVYVEKELAATQLSTMMIKPLFARFLPLFAFNLDDLHFTFVFSSSLNMRYFCLKFYRT